MKLAAQNKVGKYMQYAIGEIVLVVIGILIALQVNIWNQERKNHKVEKELLQQFQNDLNDDLQLLDKISATNKKTILSCEILIKHLTTNIPYHDSLEVHFDRWRNLKPLTFNRAAYENLTIRGLELISNKTLRNEILKLYNTTYEKTNAYNNYFKEDYHSFLAIIYLKNVKPVEWVKTSIPVDYNSLKENILFINTLEFSKNGHRVNNLDFSNTQKEIRKLMDLINKELK